MLNRSKVNDTVVLRKFPYPYKAGVSICSDIDYTESAAKFRQIQTFLNDTIGLKFSNTFFPFHEKGEFSWFSGRVEDKDTILEYIKKGAIDAIHSYGEKSDIDRQAAVATLNELRQNDCRLSLWIDHAYSKSNFCKHRFYGLGDVPQAAQYHADLTLAYGVKFIWTERLTNIVGQDTPLGGASLWDIFEIERPCASLSCLMKTLAKTFLAFCGYEKYDYFKTNALLRVATLQDKQKVYEFIRFNNSYARAGEARRASFPELARLISARVLRRLKSAGGYSIVYVHLGKDFSLETRAGRRTVNALLNLKKESDQGEIFVARTSKILEFHVAQKFLRWSFEIADKKCYINISGIDDPIHGLHKPEVGQLAGITFYVPRDTGTRVYYQDGELSDITRNPVDFTGRESVTINGCV